MKVMSVNLKGQFRYIMWCDKPSVMNFGSITEETAMKSIRRSVTSVQTVHWVNQPDATSREFHTNAEPLFCEVM